MEVDAASTAKSKPGSGTGAVAAAAAAAASTAQQPAPSCSSSPPAARAPKNCVLASHTIRSPQFAYAHLELVTSASLPTAAPPSSSSSSPPPAVALDAIQVRTYLTSALRQFLGASGRAIAVDVLRVAGARCWLRVPRDDVSAFAAAVAAWAGTAHEGGGAQPPQHATFRMRGCSDWLGGLVGQEGMEHVWMG